MVKCWICDEEMTFEKLVSHLNHHTTAERKKAHAQQLKKERNGQSDPYLSQEKPNMLGNSKRTKGSAGTKEVPEDAAVRPDADMPIVPEGE